MGTEAWRKVVELSATEQIGEQPSHSPTPSLPALLFLLHSTLGPAGWKGGSWPFKRSCPDQQKAGCGLGPCLGQSRLTSHLSLPDAPLLAPVT